MDLATLIGILVLVGVIGSITWFLVAKYTKGSLKVILEKNAYVSGEKIKGKIDLKAKKEIKGNRFIVSLVAEKKESQKLNNNQTQESWSKVFSQEVLLEGARDYTVGFMNIYNFEIVVPKKSVIESEITNKTLKTIVNVVTAVAGGNILRWSIQARLDAKGVDLTAEQKITVTLA